MDTRLSWLKRRLFNLVCLVCVVGTWLWVNQIESPLLLLHCVTGLGGQSDRLIATWLWWSKKGLAFFFTKVNQIYEAVNAIAIAIRLGVLDFVSMETGVCAHAPDFLKPQFHNAKISFFLATQADYFISTSYESQFLSHILRIRQLKGLKTCSSTDVSKSEFTHIYPVVQRKGPSPNTFPFPTSKHW